MIMKEKLAQLPMCYSIGLMNYKGREYCVSASEERGGEIVMVDTETKKISKITGLAGGVMAIIPVPEQDGVFLAIQKFYPVFDSQEAEVVCCKIRGEISDVMAADVKTVVHLPFVHRIALTGKAGARRLIAATLCGGKDFVDDCSRPGAVYEYLLDEEMQVRKTRTILEGITKNHGMYTYEKKGGSYILISGAEGVWAIDGQCTVRKFCDEPVSDLCMYDVDGDGTDEMVCIVPFHGNAMKVLKRTSQGWECIAQEELSFGHAVWSGRCGDSTLLISCSRSGEKSTKLYRPADTEVFGLEQMNADEGIGASNICVKETENSIVLYAANHEQGEVARYTIM